MTAAGRASSSGVMPRARHVAALAAAALVALPAARAAAQSPPAADGPSQLVLTYRDGRRVSIPLADLVRFEVTGTGAPAPARDIPATTPPAAAPAAAAVHPFAATLPGTWMHRSTAVFDIQRFRADGSVLSQHGSRGTWTVERDELVVKWPNGVTHRYKVEPGATQLGGYAMPVDKREKPEPITLERMR